MNFNWKFALGTVRGKLMFLLEILIGILNRKEISFFYYTDISQRTIPWSNDNDKIIINE